MTTDMNSAVDRGFGRVKWLKLLGDILTLKTDAFVRFRDHVDGMRYAIGLLIVVSLIAGSLSFLWQAVRNPAADMQSVRDTFDQVLAQMQNAGGIPAGGLSLVREQFESVMGIVEGIVGLPTPLPQPISHFLEALGQWLSSPFARLGAWLSYGIWVLLLARLLLGAKGSLRDFLATTPLYSVPQLFTILALVPCLGSLLGIVATVWGWLIYTKATAVSLGWVQQRVGADGLVIGEETQWGRALVAVFLPAILLFVLIFLAALVIIMLTALSSNGGR
ncbi:MAG: hypothetical protein WAW03_00165 [Anaerolineae bacterium]|uniref:hypothetical protein n=1 Tax=Candidatus Amarolinea dominans TaxID=3140696 RepID=UPI001D411F32|nr:hypothetical protein [Anaerolineae bacterium]MBK7199302.1 hypothetical protein [Anaerolineae bacterium]MBK9230619.1 hypothetical protein [Anaerolineae bacterium]